MNCYTTYPITPMGKPRMTQRDRWKERPVVMRYRQFKDDCRSQGMVVPERFKIVFEIPMPDSWSKKKRASMERTPHRSRPDIDNLLKAVMDAVLAEDSHVHHVEASKVWSVRGAIQIESMG